MRVAATIGAAGDVVEVVDPLDCERDMNTAVERRQVASRVLDLVEIYQSALVDVGSLHALQPQEIAVVTHVVVRREWAGGKHQRHRIR